MRPLSEFLLVIALVHVDEASFVRHTSEDSLEILEPQVECQILGNKESAFGQAIALVTLP